MQIQHFDQVFKHELDVQYSWHPSISLLFCLCMMPHDRNSCMRQSKKHDNRGPIMQLTYWYTLPAPKNLATRPKSIVPQFLFMIFVAPRVTHILRDFLQDTSRSGKYAMTAETHANASVSCMKYLFRARLGPPINLHHTPRNLARRRNSPWHWRRYKKLIRRLPSVDGNQATLPICLLARERWMSRAGNKLYQNSKILKNNLTDIRNTQMQRDWAWISSGMPYPYLRQPTSWLISYVQTSHSANVQCNSP